MKNKLNQINQFNGGMVKDVEPLMTPNTVMTDCLNGTLITYNGNEFALQNDMGNYSFKNGGLSNGFVPVGMKEHQGVLYIISYNPVTDKVEIGSFPSQQTIFTPTIDNTESTIKDITIIENKESYSNLEGKTNLILFSREPEYYLNPGDKYLLLALNKEASFKEILKEINKTAYWKHLVPYILTDENKLYNVDGFLELQADKGTTNPSDWIPVSWDIPGWLAVKFNITVPEQFNIYFDKSKTYIEKSSKDNSEIITIYPSGDLRVQTYWDLINYTEESLEDIKNNLVYFLHNEPYSEHSFDNIDPIKLDSNTLIAYNNFQSIIYNTIPAKDLTDKKYITPALLVKDNDEDKYIIYNQFTQVISRNPIIIDPNEISFGKDYFKYFVGDSSLTILSSWKSFPGVNLEYQLWRYAVDDLELHRTSDWTSVSDLVSNGTIILDITFSDNNEDSYIVNEEKIVNFNKEDIYFLKVRYSINVESEQESNITGNIWEKPIYVTELVNRWYYIKDDFTTIEPQDIIDYFADYIKLELNKDNYAFVETPFLKIRYDNNENEVKDYEFNAESTSGNYLDNIKLVYPNELPNSYTNSHVGIKTIFKQGNKYSIIKLNNNPVYSIIVPKDQKGEDGRLWRGLNIKELNNGKAVDSKGNTYTLTFNKDTESFSFDLFNTFTITNTEYNIVKEISVRDKYLYEFHPIGETKTKVKDNKDGTGTITYRPEYVEFRKDGSGRDTWSMCFWKKNVNPLEIKFKENELYYGNTKLDPNNSQTWPFGDLNISTSNNWNRTGWKPDGNSATSTKSYADDYGFNIYNFYNAKFGSDSSHSGDSGVFGPYGGGTNLGLAMSYETKDSWPCIYYCSSKAPSKNRDNNAYISKTCIYSYLMMVYCLRYCLGSKSEILYYSLYNYRESFINSVYIKTINLSGSYDWKYFMNKGTEVPEKINTLFNENLFTDLNTLLSTNTNVNFNCIVTPDETFKDYIQNKIDEKNSEVRIAIDTLERQPNIKNGDLYLIKEYDENKNKVKLTDAVKSMIFTDQIRSTMGSTLELFMRWSDNNTRSVAREFTSNIYNDISG